MEENSTIRLLRSSDMDGAMRLVRAAGWNQVEADWQRLLKLEPEGCFALEAQGQLAATTTLLCYGKELAWLGMVLTAPEFRRRGYAELLLERALKLAEERGIAEVKLDATDAGVGLYRKFGFVEECEIERWLRPAAPFQSAQPFHSKEGLSYDPNAFPDDAVFGADRAALLEPLRELGAASLAGEGFAMGRPGFSASYFGPCVAKSSDAARKLLRWFLGNHGERQIFWDLFPANKEAVRIAQESGFAPVRRLTRMVLSSFPACTVANRAEIFAIAGFELG